MAEVNDLWKMNVAKHFKLRGGSKGMHHSVSWVYVCQENNIAPWVQGKEILILYGAAMQCDEEHLVQLVRDCKKCDISAILAMIGHFISEIPDRMIEEADKLEIPLLETNCDIPISCVTKEIADLILSNNKFFHRSGGDVFQMIIDGSLYGYKDVRAVLKESGYDWNDRDYVYIIQFADHQVLEHIRRVTENLVVREMGTKTWFWKDNRMIGLAGCGDDESIISIMESVYRKLFEKYQAECQIGIGTEIQENDSCLSSYKNADIAILFERIIEGNDPVVALNSFPTLIQLIVNNESQKLIDQIVESTIGDLISNDWDKGTDLLGTLKVYIECNGNVKEAAEHLFIHRNTMVYRIHQIESLTGKKLSDIKDASDILTAYYAHRYKLFKNTKNRENDCSQSQ